MLREDVRSSRISGVSRCGKWERRAIRASSFIIYSMFLCFHGKGRQKDRLESHSLTFSLLLVSCWVEEVGGLGVVQVANRIPRSLPPIVFREGP
jgi:hypothetical protein